MTRKELINSIARKADTAGIKLNVAEVSRVVSMVLDAITEPLAEAVGKEIRKTLKRAKTKLG